MMKLSLWKNRTVKDSKKIAEIAQARLVPGTTFINKSSQQDWYSPVMLGAGAISKMITNSTQINLAKQHLQELEPDEYSKYMIGYYEEGLSRYGKNWGYADIVTTLITLTQVLQPRRYLEVGVRRGRSATAVGRISPNCKMTLLDMWISDYAGMENPGPDLVRAELEKVQHKGEVTFLDGDSHILLPQHFARGPDVFFDLITVDGDHSEQGARQDIKDVTSRLNIGGAIVFDDISHPQHPELSVVWNDMIVSAPNYSSWSYTEVGYGVGFAIRNW